MEVYTVNEWDRPCLGISLGKCLGVICINKRPPTPHTRGQVIGSIHKVQSKYPPSEHLASGLGTLGVLHYWSHITLVCYWNCSFTLLNAPSSLSLFDMNPVYICNPSRMSSHKSVKLTNCPPCATLHAHTWARKHYTTAWWSLEKLSTPLDFLGCPWCWGC